MLPPAVLTAEALPARSVTTLADVRLSLVSSMTISKGLDESAPPLTENDPPPRTGSSSTTRLPTTWLTPTKDAGHGTSKTVPRQVVVNTSLTVMHFCSDAHHAWNIGGRRNWVSRIDDAPCRCTSLVF